MEVSTGIKQSAAAVAAAAAASSGAMAADLAPFKAPLAPPTVVGWEGFYLGASVGASWLKSQQNDPGSLGTIGYAASSSTGSSQSARGVGWLGGVQLGYNLQHGNFVYGLETDFSFLGSGSASSNGNATRTYTGGANTYSYSAGTNFSSKVDQLATFRARFGIDFNGTLPYFTGGFALGRVSNTFGVSGYTPRNSVASASVTQTSWVPGVVLGGGIEHQLSRNWTIKGEVLWVGFQDKTVQNPLASTTYGAPSSNGVPIKFSNELTLFKVGMNYRF